MVFRNRAKLAKLTVNSTKHIVQIGPSTVALGAILNQGIAVATRVGDVDALNEVRIGSNIKAVYLELWLTSDDATQSSGIITLEKIPLASDPMAVGDAAALDSYFNKNNVFYITQGLMGPAIGNAVPFVRGWFKIPKGKQRMSEGSRINLNISAVLDGLRICGVVIYKEYY